MENPRFAIFQFRAPAIIISAKLRCAAPRRRNVYHKPDSTQTELPPLIFLFVSNRRRNFKLPTHLFYICNHAVDCMPCFTVAPGFLGTSFSRRVFPAFTIFHFVSSWIAACWSKFIEHLVSFCLLIRLFSDFLEQDTLPLKLSLALFTNSAISTSMEIASVGMENILYFSH